MTVYKSSGVSELLTFIRLSFEWHFTGFLLDVNLLPIPGNSSNNITSCAVTSLQPQLGGFARLGEALDSGLTFCCRNALPSLCAFGIFNFSWSGPPRLFKKGKAWFSWCLRALFFCFRRLGLGWGFFCPRQPLSWWSPLGSGKCEMKLTHDNFLPVVFIQPLGRESLRHCPYH